MLISRCLQTVGALLAVLLTLVACQRSADAPAGAVILTAAGAITKTNRGPYDDKLDLFFKHHEVSFKKAFVFDREMLLLLGREQVTLRPPDIGREVTLQGPSLKSVLAALGIENPQYLRFLALDGYATELDGEAIAAKDWIVAVDVDGRPLQIGREGPIWVVFRPQNPPDVSEAEVQSWPWAVFYMEVR